jgi:hypothetical protein
MPQGAYETPVELIVAADGAVKASILGPVGTLRIDDVTGRVRGSRLALGARTSWGRLKLTTQIDGDRLRGKWAPAGFASLFFKGDVRGLRDRSYAPAPRLAAFDAAWSAIERDFYAPDFAGVDMTALHAHARAEAAAAQGDGAFLAIMRRTLAEFRTSHLDFFATPGWTPELHPNAPPSAPADGGISWRQLVPGAGYLRIESLEDSPLGVARIDQAFAALGSEAALIVDLRGNGGGSIGAAMRLGDHLFAAPRPVGYFASRAGLARRGARSIDAIDASALERFSGYDGGDFAREMAAKGALMLTTGGRAGAPYRGRIVLLVDSDCFSACEALASVVKEAGAATLIGRRTAGAMLGMVPVELPGGWTLTLPVWDFRTPGGARVEGRGVEPDIAVKEGRGDPDLAAARRFLKAAARPGAART